MGDILTEFYKHSLHSLEVKIKRLQQPRIQARDPAEFPKEPASEPPPPFSLLNLKKVPHKSAKPTAIMCHITGGQLRGNGSSGVSIFQLQFSRNGSIPDASWTGAAGGGGIF